MRTEWDAIVVGLGGIGSGAAFWLSERLGDRVLGLEQFELGHLNGASQDHSRIIRLSYHRPDYVRLAKRAYATWAEVEARAGETIVTVTGGPRRRAARRGDPAGRLHGRHGRRGRPVRAPRRGRDHAPLAAVAPRRGAPRPLPGSVGLADPNRGNAAHLAARPGERRDAARPLPGDAAADAGGGVEVTTADGTVHRAATVVVAADAWTNELLGLRPAAAADDHEGAGHVLRLPGPGRVRPGPLPDLDLDGRACSTASRRTARPARRAPRMSGGVETTAAKRTFDRDEAADERLTAFMAAQLPARSAADLHEDLPVHAHSRP
jgi:sarcosine oxidase